MRRSVVTAIGLGLALLLGNGIAVFAHEGGGEGLQVEPANVTAGDTAVLAGIGLEPNSDRVLVLVGGELTIAFGTVTTDADGQFSKELTIPSYLPSGSYELRAIGDETLTTALGVTAVAGGAAASPPADDARENVAARDRSPVELALILAFVVIVAGLGILIVWRAEQFGGRATT
jgi:hypothetical protein